MPEAVQSAPAAQAVAPAAPQAPKLVPLAYRRRQWAEQAYRTHFVLVPAGTPREHLLNPAFWAFQARDMNPLDRVEVVDDHATWLETFIVRVVGKEEVLLAPILRVELAPAPAMDLPAAFAAEWLGHKRKWAARRLSDGVIIREEMPSREEAETYIRSHVKAMAA